MELALYIIGTLAVLLFLAVVYLLGMRWRDLEKRVEALESERPTKRLSHKDNLNLENAQSAFIKALLDLDNIQDYLRTGLKWAGRVRSLGDDDDDEPK